MYIPLRWCHCLVSGNLEPSHRSHYSRQPPSLLWLLLAPNPVQNDCHLFIVAKNSLGPIGGHYGSWWPWVDLTVLSYTDDETSPLFVDPLNDEEYSYSILSKALIKPIKPAGPANQVASIEGGSNQAQQASLSTTRGGGGGREGESKKTNLKLPTLDTSSETLLQEGSVPRTWILSYLSEGIPVFWCSGKFVCIHSVFVSCINRQP